MERFQLLPAISTLCIIISAILVAIGWYYIRKKEIEKHKNLMLLAAVFAVIFFIIYSGRTIFIGNTSFGGPEHLATLYTVFLVFHILLSTSGAVFGIIQIRTGLKDQVSIHRKFGPLASVIWFLTAITGVMVYTLLYVLFPGGETTSLIKAIFGP